MGNGLLASRLRKPDAKMIDHGGRQEPGKGTSYQYETSLIASRAATANVGQVLISLQDQRFAIPENSGR